MTEEVASEPVVSEPQPTPEATAGEAVIEPTLTPEPTPTAQPVEPLNSEPVEAPESAMEVVSEPEVSAPESQPSVPAPIPVVTKPDPRSLFAKAREMIQFRKRKKLDKVMGLFLKNQSIRNDDVQKLLYVSDATATRYLDQLEREGKIKKENAGKYLSYSRM